MSKFNIYASKVIKSYLDTFVLLLAYNTLHVYKNSTQNLDTDKNYLDALLYRVLAINLDKIILNSTYNKKIQYKLQDFLMQLIN